MKSTFAEKETKKMQEIYSPKLGKISYNSKEVILFESGLFGFPHLKKFILVASKEFPLFMFLQSLEENTMFILSSGKLLLKNYEVILHETSEKKIDNELVLNIVTTNPNEAGISINLLGPILLNAKEKTGRQVVAEGDLYYTKHIVNNSKMAELINKKKSLLSYIIENK